MAQHDDSTVNAALEAYARGYTPIPIRSKSKRPLRPAWTHTTYASADEVRAEFEDAVAEGAHNIGLALGRGNLVDIDLDHPLAMLLRDYFIPPSAMETGRPGSPRSHRWFIVEGDVPVTRQYKMPDKSMVIEMRSTGGQTLIPPSIWSDKSRPEYTEPYQWEGEPWGGDEGPAVIPTRVLSVQVALLSLAAVLVENWPGKGSRHEAYLHLAGGLLRHGDMVHEFWEQNIGVLISALADVTRDEDGAQSRIAETVTTTINRIKRGGKVAGFPKLAEIIGQDHADMARRMAKEVESLAGFVPEVLRPLDTPVATPDVDEVTGEVLDDDSRNPMEERISSWAAVDLGPYLSGQVTVPEPTVLRREDGQALIYPGRVNMLYGKSESAKSWIAMYACIQEMGLGERVVYLDFEDEPVNTLARMRLLGAGDDDIQKQFRYVHPEGPLSAMQRYQFGHNPTEEGIRSESIFWSMLDSFDPTLIVADGLTALYGLHGHDTNHATSTDVITTWFKSLTRYGRTSVIVIDHTGKNSGPGASPIGAHHKTAMVQGISLRVDAIARPMPGALGHVRLTVFKDRIGKVREASSTGTDEQVAADVWMDSRVDGMVKMEVKVPSAIASPSVATVTVSPAAIQRQSDIDSILDWLEDQRADESVDDSGGWRTSEIAAAVGLSEKRTSALLRELVSSGMVEKTGMTKGARYHYYRGDDE